MDREQLLDTLVTEYLKAVEAGQQPDTGELLARHPDLAGELAEFFAAQKSIDQAAAPFRAHAPAPVPASEAPKLVPAPLPLCEAPTLVPGTAPARSGSRTIRYFGDYELIEEIARGGMGVVYKARQVSLNRIVALKMILTGNMASPEDVRRFHVEAEAAAKLDHPGIVPVFEVGEYEGQHYFSMGFVEGESLAARVVKGVLSPHAAADLTKRIAQAIAYAHTQGVIHRDLKPGNVLLDKAGQPRVTDFGLAKRILTEAEKGIDFSEHLTATGAALGTPSYMPPEQAGGKSAEIGPLSDVYSLGAIFYCLVTGRPPFQAATPLDTMLQVIDQDPVPPRQLNAIIPLDVETICLKCLAKEPRNRYGSAQELIDELARFLTGVPIQARPVSNSERLWRWCKRRPLVASLAGAVAALLLVGLVGSLIVAGRERVLRTEADDARARAIENERNALANEQAANHNLYCAHMILAQQAWENAKMGLLQGLLDLHREPRAGAVDRAWEWYYQDRLCHEDLRTLRGHTDHVLSVAFSPDGARVASASLDGTVRLWNAATGNEIRTLMGHKSFFPGPAFSPDGVLIASATSLAFSPDGVFIASASKYKTVQLWEAATGNEIRTLREHTGWVTCVAFSPDGKRIATASLDRTLKLWNATTGKAIQTIQGLPANTDNVAFSPNGAQFAAAFGNGTVKLWDTSTGNEIRILKAHTAWVNSVAFSPNGSRIATASADKTIKLWDATTGEEIRPFTGHTGGVLCVAFSRDGSRLASAGLDNVIKLWDAATGNEIRSFKGHGKPVKSLAFSPDGARLASASLDSTVKLWDAASDNEVRTLKGTVSRVSRVAFSPSGSKLASTQGMTVKLWDAATGNEIRRFKGHSNLVTSVAFSPDGTRIASGGLDGMKLWDVASCNVIHAFKEGDDPINGATIRSVAISPDGGRLAAAYGNIVKLWDAATLSEICTFEGHRREVASIAFSPDGVRLASANIEGTITLWDASTGKEIHTFKDQEAHFTSVTFSPDGARLASASTDSTVKLWDAATGNEIRTLKGHSLYVHSVAFSPDGARLASASADETVKLWDAATGSEIRSLKGHVGYVHSVAFSPDGTRIASAGSDMTVKLWDATPLTPALREEREAIGLLGFFANRALPSKEIIANLQNYQGITDSVRQKALARAQSYCDQRIRELAENVVLEHFGKLLLRSEVLEAIRLQEGISEGLRDQALALARDHPENASALMAASWLCVSIPGGKPDAYRRALMQAEAANRLQPENGPILNTLGVAQYRAGLYAQALQTLQRSAKLNVDKFFTDPGPPPRDLAFLAMTEYQLGRKDDAQQTLGRLRQAMRKSQWAIDRISQRFLSEAETLLGAAPTPKKN